MLSLDELRRNQIYSSKVNFLIYGTFGSGKTVCATTGRGPVLIDCFDPGGARSRLITEASKSRSIAVDYRFSSGSAESIFAWEREMEERIAAKMFDQLGTYVLDSFTTWTKSLLTGITSKTGGAAKKGEPSPIRQIIPSMYDYNPLLISALAWLSRMCALPCDFILTAHIDRITDPVSGSLITGLLAPGKNLPKDPFILFDEVYLAITRQSPEGIEYKLLTKNDGIQQARTRIGGGIFETYEQPDLKALLRKAGLSDADISTKKG